MDSIYARPSVLARIHLAFLDLFAAVFAGETGSTFTLIVIDQLQACSPARARFGDAIVYAVLAQRSYESGNAMTTELVDFVHTGSTVLARVSLAVVNIHFASVPSKSRWTHALVIPRRFNASSSILARIRGTTADLVFTI